MEYNNYIQYQNNFKYNFTTHFIIFNDKAKIILRQDQLSRPPYVFYVL